MAIESIGIDEIRMDGSQTRSALDEAHVTDYLELLRERKVLPPIVVYRIDGEIWLADGFHRIEAARRNGAKAIRCDVKQGGMWDAFAFGCQANEHHGKRPTSEDKRFRVRRALTNPKWAALSNVAVAELCHVTDKTVAAVRDEVAPTRFGNSEPESTPTAPETRTGKDGKEYPAKKPKEKAKPEPKPKKNGSEVVGTKDRKAAAAALGVLIRALDKIGVGLAMAEHTRAIDRAIKEA